MAPTVESHGRRIILESDPYVGSWRRKQAEKGIDVLTETCLKKKKKKIGSASLLERYWKLESSKDGSRDGYDTIWRKRFVSWKQDKIYRFY